MNLDLYVLCQLLQDAKEEEILSTEGVNPYLLNEVLKPLLCGKRLCYGDIDYTQFEADDLRILADHYDRRCSAIHRLETLAGVIAKAAPAACRSRAFC